MKKILYAEDEYSNRKLLELKLKKNNISCDLATDGHMALDLFNQNHYDLVILDLYMPGLNGDSVAEHIRKTHPNIPIIAITSDDEQIYRLKKIGFNEVLIKPIHKKESIDIIKEYLGM